MAFDERGKIIRGMPRGREIIPQGHIAHMGDLPPASEHATPEEGKATAEAVPDPTGKIQEELLQFFVECWRDAGIDKRR